MGTIPVIFCPPIELIFVPTIVGAIVPKSMIPLETERPPAILIPPDETIALFVSNIDVINLPLLG